MVLIIVLSNLLSVLCSLIFREYFSYFATAIIYFVAFPIGCIPLKSLPPLRLQAESFSAVDILRLICACAAALVIGNLIGSTLKIILEALTQAEQTDIVASSLTGMSVIWIFVNMVILAPCAEEFLFRRLIFDRVQGFGKWNAILFSAVTFALLHGNIEQLFYAFLIGLVLGYAYSKTQRLLLPILLHAGINLFGSIVTLYVGTIPPLGMLYILLVLIACIAGIIFIVNFIKQQREQRLMGRAHKESYVNWGFLALLIVSLALIVINALPAA
ncbi:MAG: type II CAAX endopeptidase family protein [Clostridia bacterium]|nr:type II CAAX endopeptidase family protein [Clostridia bacterium]